jgi:hypothetical protein
MGSGLTGRAKSSKAGMDLSVILKENSEMSRVLFEIFISIL